MKVPNSISDEIKKFTEHYKHLTEKFFVNLLQDFFETKDN